MNGITASTYTSPAIETARNHERPQRRGASIGATLLWSCLIATAAFALLHGQVQHAQAAGTLSPVGTADAPIEIRDHHVDVVINNGFAKTEVVQTFFNPNATELEALYSFPVPRSASLSEVTILTGETEMHGEVLPKQKAKEVYKQEKSQGNKAGLTEKNSFYTYEFRVYPVPADGEVKLRFVYYQPIEIDTGVGRYVYPLADGNTDEAAMKFWTSNDQVKDMLSFDIELKSGVPVADVRVNGFPGSVTTDRLGEGRLKLHGEATSATLNEDLVIYYKLAENQPGRVDFMAYRPDENAPGTFMMVLTPGIDLPPITGGQDYVFVLDTSGSMSGRKVTALQKGLAKAIDRLQPEDRFRIITFNSSANELTRAWVGADAQGKAKAATLAGGLSANGSTNLYDGLQLAVRHLDDDRATSIVLVTDAVTNTGVVDPKAFHALMQQYDVRVFGFLMGNSGNWPLMRTITQTSGGFFQRVSTADDIVGQVMQASSKVTHEALLNAELKIAGVETFETSNMALGKVYRGEQIVMFGRYDAPGTADITLNATRTGEDKTYHTRFAFPARDTRHPELERLWALHRIEQAQTLRDQGMMPASETASIVRDLGVTYQLVTDETSMVVLTDEAFASHGIDRNNRDRTARERAAQQQRSSEPVRTTRVDEQQPMFDGVAPGIGGGGGAIDPISGAIALSLGGLAWAGSRRRKHRKQDDAATK